MQHGVRKGYPLRCGIANYSVASVKALGDPYFVLTGNAKHGSMLVGKPRRNLVDHICQHSRECQPAVLQVCGLTHSPCGYFLNCRDKICAMPNPLSGKLLQGAVSFHVSLVIFLSKRRTAHFSPVKGLTAISCRCRTSESLNSERKAAAFSHARHTGRRHGRALGKSACCDGSSRAATNQAHVISRLARLSVDRYLSCSKDLSVLSRRALSLGRRVTERQPCDRTV